MCFHVHRALLLCRIPFFDTLFAFNQRTGVGHHAGVGVSTRQVALDVYDIDADACRHVLAWAYTDQLQVEVAELWHERVAEIKVRFPQVGPRVVTPAVRCAPPAASCRNFQLATVYTDT